MIDPCEASYHVGRVKRGYRFCVVHTHSTAVDEESFHDNFASVPSEVICLWEREGLYPGNISTRGLTPDERLCLRKVGGLVKALVNVAKSVDGTREWRG